MTTTNGRRLTSVPVSQSFGITKKLPVDRAILRDAMGHYVELRARYQAARAEAFVELFQEAPDMAYAKANKYVQADTEVAALELAMEKARIEVVVLSYIINGRFDSMLAGLATQVHDTAGR